jgi:tetratricopeptide (TPR) repeat protein
VAAIVERKNWDDYLGSSLLAEGMMEEDGNKVDRAVWYLENAVEYDPYNEAAYLELGNAYTASLRFDEARSAMDRLLEFYPDYDKAYNTKGYSYLIEAEVRENEALIDEAIRFINLAIRSNYKYYTGYYNLGLCYGMKKDRDNAEYNFQRAIWYNGRFREAYERLAELYDFYGETENANLVREQASRLP